MRKYFKCKNCLFAREVINMIRCENPIRKTDKRYKNFFKNNRNACRFFQYNMDEREFKLWKSWKEEENEINQTSTN